MQFSFASIALLFSVSVSSVMALPSPNGLVATEKSAAVLMDRRTGLPVPRIAKRDDPSVHDLLNSCPRANSKRFDSPDLPPVTTSRGLEGADVCTWSQTGNNGEKTAQSVAEE